MEGLVVSSDQWHLVSKWLTVKDLCRLMQVSRNWFHLWISDRAWMHQRNRVCRRFKELNSVFDLYCDQGASTEHMSKRTQKSNSNKKRKTPWITPKRGIWYVFKKWLMMGKDMSGVKKLYKNPSMHPIVVSVVTTLIPFQERIVKTDTYAIDNNVSVVNLYWDWDKYFQCNIYKRHNWFSYLLCYNYASYDIDDIYLQVNYYFTSWTHFLLERRPISDIYFHLFLSKLSVILNIK